jgi:hypothetical protein
MPNKPMREEDRGESRPPAGEKAFRFWEANRIPAKYIGWRVASLMRHNTSYGPVSFSELLTELYRNPAIIQAWKAGETEQDVIEHRAFQKLCYLIAQDILACNPDVQISVIISPKDQPVATKTEARDKDRRITRNESYRRRYESYRRLEREMGVDEGAASREAAKARFSEREDISVPTIERLISFVEKEDVA